MSSFHYRSRVILCAAVMSAVLLVLFNAGCSRSDDAGKEYAYVSVPQANLRDRLAVIYNKRGVVKSGQRVEILDRSRRFCRVRAQGIGEGWIEERYLIDQKTYDAFRKMDTQYANAPAQAHGSARFELNMHLEPSRDAERLYQLKQDEKVDILQRAVTDKNAKLMEEYQQKLQNLTAKQSEESAEVKKTTGPSSNEVKNAVSAAKVELPHPPPSIPEDWWLVRNQQSHVGWVLARMVYIDIPLEVAQYAEGKRIVGSFILNTVQDVKDGQTRQMRQYLVVTTEPKDGQPFDFDQIRIFTWNNRRHRYETAYRERNLFGVFPVSVGHAVFDKEGDLPTFTIRVKDDTGKIQEKNYKMNGPIVHRVLSPEEEAAQKSELEERLAERKAAREARSRLRAEHQRK